MSENTREGQMQTVSPTDASQQLSSVLESAFNYSLISYFLSAFPIGSFVAIFLSIKSSKLLKKAKLLAEQNHTEPGWEHIVSNIAGKVGLFRGIALSAYWTSYMLFFVLYFSFIMFIAILAAITGNL